MHDAPTLRGVQASDLMDDRSVQTIYGGASDIAATEAAWAGPTYGWQDVAARQRMAQCA